jgi:hypothetical protein
MCWFSQTDLASFTWLVGMLHKPVHAAATTTTGRQQNTEIAATAQPELSDVPMQASTYACLFLCISLVQQNLQLVPV